MSNSRRDGDGPTADGQDTVEALVPEALSSEQVEDLKNRAARADDNWERLLRTTADFENYKKRAQREREEGIRNANESLLRKLLPVLDGLDMAMAAADQDTSAPAQSLQAGVAMIYQQLQKALQESGMEEIVATGKAFDPKFHEAVSQEEREDVPEGQVLQQLRKGYRVRDRLLRPASVVVARKPGA